MIVPIEVEIDRRSIKLAGRGRSAEHRARSTPQRLASAFRVQPCAY